MNQERQQAAKWIKDVNESAGNLGLQCSVLDAAMMPAMGFPCLEGSGSEAGALLLWNLQQRPICVYRIPGKSVIIAAKVLQPDIQFGIGTVLSEDKFESLFRVVKGIAFMVGENRLKVCRQMDDIEAVLEFGGAEPPATQLLTNALQELMTVQNVFQRSLAGELADSLVDFIALNYVLSKTS